MLTRLKRLWKKDSKGHLNGVVCHNKSNIFEK